MPASPRRTRQVRRQQAQRRHRRAFEVQHLEPRTMMAVWIGGGATTNWSDAGNWDAAGVPDVAGETAVFNGGGATINLDIPISISNLTFATGGYTINSTLPANTITLDAASDELVQTAGSNAVNAVVAGATIDVKVNGGTLAFSAANTYTGTTQINGGVLQGAASATINPLGTSALVLNGGTLDLNVTGATFNNALGHYGYHINNDLLALDISGNNGVMGLGDPSSFTAFEGLGTLINGPGSRGLDFDNDADFNAVPASIMDDASGDGFVINQADNYTNLWTGTLTPDVGGNWSLRNNGDDDIGAFWIDLDRDGIFETTVPGRGTNRGEQASYDETGGKTVALTAGLAYPVAFMHREGGGGSAADFRFTRPAGTEVRIKPGEAAQAGLWNFTNLTSLALNNNVTVLADSIIDIDGNVRFNNLNFATADADLTIDSSHLPGSLLPKLTIGGTTTLTGNNVLNAEANVQLVGVVSGGGLTKSNTGALLLSNTNTYTGDTIIAGGMVYLGANGALGDDIGKTTIQAGASLDIRGFRAGTLGNELVEVAGTGVGGIGAILNSGASQTGAFRRITMTGDATIRTDNRVDIRNMDGAAILDMGGFTLTKIGGAEFALVNVTVNNEGNVNVNTNIFRLEGTTDFDGPTRTINVANGATLDFWNSTQTHDVNVTLAGGANFTTNDNAGAGPTVTGTITLNGLANFNIEKDTTLSGQITGTGAINKITGTGSLTLSNNTSNFTGSNIIAAGTVIVTAGNALGAASPTTNSTMVLSGAAVHFSGGISVPETFVIAGSGTGNGALVNVSGDNTLTAATMHSLGADSITIGSLANKLTIQSALNLSLSNLNFVGAGNIDFTGAITSGGLRAGIIDLDDATALVGNRTTNTADLYRQLLPYAGPGRSDFVLQRLGMVAPTGAANVIVPYVDFGSGTETTPGNGATIDRGGYDNGGIPPWQGLFNSLGITADMDGDQITASFSGKINIVTGGSYTFTTRSDDGSVLYINGQLVVNNNNAQGMTNRSGTITLAAGLHDISIGFFEGAGGAGVQASYSGPDTANARVIIPPAVLFNDVATAGTFVSGGLRGNFYDTNNNIGGFNFGTDEWLLNISAPDDTTPFESLVAAQTRYVAYVDFGIGTENVPGTGAPLDRAITTLNPYGGIGVDLGVDQVGILLEGYLNVPETAAYTFTVVHDDHMRVFIDRNNDGDFNDASELVVQSDAATTTTVTGVSLNAGSLPIRILSGEGSGGARLQVSWQQTTGTTFARRVLGPADLGIANRAPVVTKSGTGTVLLANGGNTYSGGTVISQGTLLVGHPDALGAGNVTINDANTGANNTALLATFGDAGNAINNNITVANLGTGTTTIGTSSFSAGSVPTFYDGTIALNRATTLFGGSTDRTTYRGVISGNGAITVSGPGTAGTGVNRTTLDNNSNSFTGNISISGTGTTLQLNGTNVIPNTVDVDVAAGNFLYLNTASETIDGLTGAGTVQIHPSVATSSTLTIGANNAASTFTGNLNNGGSGGATLSLTKTGTGTQVIAGSGATANTASGLLRVQQGQLDVGAGFATDGAWSGNVTIDSGATLRMLQGNVFANGSDFTINGTLDMNAQTDVIGNLSGSGSIINNTSQTTGLLLDDLGAAYVFSGVITGNGALGVSGNVSIAGSQTLTGAGHVLSDINVSRGTLVLNGGFTANVSQTVRVGIAGTSDGVAYTTPANSVANLNIGASASITTPSFLMGENPGNIAFTANVNMSGGTLNVTGAGGNVGDTTSGFRVGHWGNETSTFNLSGGTVNVTNDLSIGWDGVGIWNQTGGTTNAGATRLVINDGNSINTGGSGTVTLNAGTFNVGANGLKSAGGTSVLNLGGGTLRATANWDTLPVNGSTKTVDIVLTNAVGAGVIDTNGFDVNLTSLITGAGALNKIGAGTLSLGNAASTFTGNLNVAVGRVNATAGHNDTAATSALGHPLTPARQIAVVSGATLGFGANDVLGNASVNPTTPIIVNGGTVTNNGNFFNTLGPVTLNGGTLTSIGGANASYQAFRLAGPVSVTGSTPSTISSNGAANSGFHLLAPTTFDVGNVTGDAAADLTLSATLINEAGSLAAANLNKIGAGTLQLTGANAYSGATTVAAGTLLVNSAGSATGSSTVTVNSGATLAGIGSIQGNVNVSGTLSPGLTPGSFGTLAIGGNLALLASSNYAVDGNATTSDLTTATNISINAAANLVANVPAGLAAGETIIFLDAVNPVTGQFATGVADLGTDRRITLNGTESYFLTNGDPNTRFPDVVATQVAIVRNSPVIARDNTYTMLLNSVLTGNVKTDDDATEGVDFDPDADATVALVGPGPTAAQGVLALSTNGAFIFTPKANFRGPVTFQYRLTDSEGSDTATVTINVTNIMLDDEGNLLVGGTTGDDRIIVQSGNGGVSIRYNNLLSIGYPATNVIVYGNAGNDTITVTTAANASVEFYGGAGNDYLAGSSKDDILDGGEGSDRLLGGLGDDFIYGGAGNDTLSGGVGDDTMYGDSFRNADGDPQLPPAAQQGKDNLNGDIGDDKIYGEGNVDTLYGGLGSDLARGGDGNDTINGDDGDDTLTGDAGTDKLYGRAGNDVLLGGLGLDSLYGGTGEDLLFGNAMDDETDETLRDIYLDWFGFGPGNQTTAAQQIKDASRPVEAIADLLYGEGGRDWYLMYFSDKVAQGTEKPTDNTIERFT